MVNSYKENSAIQLQITVPTENDGSAMTIIGVSFSLYENATLMSGPTVLPTTSTNGIYTHTIPANLNVVGGTTEVKSVFRANYTFTSALGTKVVNVRYIVEKEDTLIHMENTFQTLSEAHLIASDLTDLDMWLTASEDYQVNSLKMAYDKISRLAFRFERDSKEYLDHNRSYGYIHDMSDAEPSDWESFPKDFKLAIRKAQVLEANQILQGSEVEDKRRDGIISETIGESKMFFNSRIPIRLPVCRAAMNVLSKFIYKSNKIGRA